MEKAKTNTIIRWAIVAILFLSAIVTAINIMQYNQKMQEAEQLEKEKEVLEEQVEQMRYRLDSPLDDDYVARVAREKLGLCYPDEIIFYGDVGNGKE